MTPGKFFAAVILTIAAFAPAAASAAYSELSVTSKGELSAKGLTVMQKAGSTLYVRATWDESYVRLVVTTGPSTVITKNYGESSSISEVEAGHLIDVEGSLVTGSDTITIMAKKLRDTSLVKESKSFSGAIKKIDSASQSFVLSDKSLGDITVVVLASTPITQGKRQVAFSTLKVGDKVLSISGTYDYTSKLLSPTGIEMFQSKDVFVARNFEGTLKSVSGNSLPAQLVVTVGGTDYTVFLSDKSSVLSKNKAPTSLRRFTEGDKVRFWGAVRETNLGEIDGEIVRNLNF